jgi:hypothetical protein
MGARYQEITYAVTRTRPWPEPAPWSSQCLLTELWRENVDQSAPQNRQRDGPTRDDTVDTQSGFSEDEASQTVLEVSADLGGCYDIPRHGRFPRSQGRERYD